MKEGYDVSKATLGAKYYRNKEGRGCCEVQSSEWFNFPMTLKVIG